MGIRLGRGKYQHWGQLGMVLVCPGRSEIWDWRWRREKRRREERKRRGGRDAFLSHRWEACLTKTERGSHIGWSRRAFPWRAEPHDTDAYWLHCPTHEREFWVRNTRRTFEGHWRGSGWRPICEAVRPWRPPVSGRRPLSPATDWRGSQRAPAGLHHLRFSSRGSMPSTGSRSFWASVANWRYCKPLIRFSTSHYSWLPSDRAGGIGGCPSDSVRWRCMAMTSTTSRALPLLTASRWRGYKGEGVRRRGQWVSEMHVEQYSASPVSAATPCMSERGVQTSKVRKENRTGMPSKCRCTDLSTRIVGENSSHYWLNWWHCQPTMGSNADGCFWRFCNCHGISNNSWRFQ